MTTIFSTNLDDLTTEQLTQVNQGLGREIDKLRAQRAHVKLKIAERLERVQEAPQGKGDATAPGFDITVKAE